MTRSLRLRFFLITWPLVVAAVAAVTLTFDRWARVELQVLESVGESPEQHQRMEVADSLARAWVVAGGRAPDAEWTGALERLTEADSVELVLLDGGGRMVATTDTTFRLETPLDTLAAGDAVSFVRLERQGPMLGERVTSVTGRPVRDLDGRMRATLYVLPPGGGMDASEMGATLQADARRTLWTAFLVASGLAAALALLLAGPVVRQIGRLSHAAARVRSGDLSTRVGVGRPDELGRLERAFNDMAGSLERAETHKRNLVSDAAHELRTPLSNVVGILEAVEDGLKKPDASTLASLTAEARLLTELVDELQELSLAESGQLRFDMERVDVTLVVDQALAATRDGAQTLDIVGPEERGPVYAWADARRLGQAIRQLLRNAVTHTPDGGRVRVDVLADEDEVGVCVLDSGPGIPEDHLHLIWERFHRVDEARDRRRGGHGLGLAIVKQYVEGMGGRVSVGNEHPGARFDVWVRRA